MGERIRDWIAWWVVMTAFWLVLVEKTTSAEIYAGIGSAGVAALAAVAIIFSGPVQMRPELRGLLLVFKLPGQILKDCGILAGALFRGAVLRQPVDGVFWAIPFRYGGQDARSVARRALVSLYISIAPNTYVAAFDEARNLLVIHQLVRTPDPPGGGDEEWPV